MRPVPSSTLTLTLVLILLVTGTAASIGVGAQPSTPESLQQENLSAPPTEIELRVFPDGDVQWRITHRFPIDGDADRRAYERLAREFRAGQTDLAAAAAFDEARRLAQDSTGREMRFTDRTRTATTLNRSSGQVGVMTASFNWTAFGRPTTDGVEVNDAFLSGDGDQTWFPGISEGSRLTIRPPSGHGVSSAPAAPTRGVLRWEGPQQFPPGYLNVTYERLASPGFGNPLTALGTISIQTWLLVGGLGGVGLVAVVVYLRSRPELRETLGGGPQSDAGGGAPPSADQSETAGGEQAVSDPSDSELLSDEERVERLLEGNGGRMRQADIVDETGWSNAKVSQLLSAMDQADRVDKLRIGRENLISLPDEDVRGFED